MKFYYPAKITKNTDGSYDAVFPDLEMCSAHGADLYDVLENARSAMNDWISLELSEPDWELPSASDPSDIPTGPDEAVHQILVNYRFMEGYDE